MPERPGGKPMPVGGSGATYDRGPSQGGQHPPARPTGGGSSITRNGTKGTISTGTKNVALLGSIFTGNWKGVGANIASRFRKKKDTSLKTDIKGIRQDPTTGATYHKAPRHRPVIERDGDGEGGGGTQIATTGAQPVKKKPLAMKPYYMGFDFQQAKHKLGTSGQLMPDPSKRTYQGWQFKKGGLSGGERFGPPPKKGPNPHGKCPFRPDGIRGVGAVEPGRGVKFIGTK